VAKPLAAGLPLGAILTTDRVATAIHAGMHGTTFGGGPLACAVANQFLRQMEKLLPHVRDVSKYFRAQLDALKVRHTSIREIRGMGLMLGVEMNSADLAKQVVSQLMERGILINRTNEAVLRFLPPYIIEKKHIDLVIRELDAALSSASSGPLGSQTHKSTARSQS